MNIRLCSDWIRVELEPEPEGPRNGIYRIGPSPVRIAKALAVGPGRHYGDGVFVPMEVKPGDRFPFFKASTDSKSGQALAAHLPDGQEFVRMSDVLFVIEEGNAEVSL